MMRCGSTYESFLLRFWENFGGIQMSKIIKRVIRQLLTFLLALIRVIQIEARIIRFNSKLFRPQGIQLFNVDLHTSVIADLKEGIKEFDAHLVSWTLTNDNVNFRKIFKIKDPAIGLSGKLWLNLGVDDFNIFRIRYRRYLATFDGFITCFPPAFLELFLDLGKPILVVIATRYESPYTNREAEWEKFNKILKDGVTSGQLMIVANNRADRDYLKYFTQIESSHVPSVCEYPHQLWEGKSEKRLILSRGSTKLFEAIARESGQIWSTPREEFGLHFSWSDLHQVSEIFFLPYQISTMTLFELATSGVPVSVPSIDLIKLLRKEDTEILSELSFYQVRGLPTSNLSGDNPNKTEEDSIIDWWLSRADFYDLDLMPNIRVISSLSDLANPHPFNVAGNREQQIAELQERNWKLSMQRHAQLASFLEIVERSQNKSITMGP